jgi:hypothetical protein
VTSRTSDLGPVLEEAGGAQRHEHQHGGQAKMLGPHAKEAPAIPNGDPAGDGQGRDRLQSPPGNFDRCPGDLEPSGEMPDDWTKRRLEPAQPAGDLDAGDRLDRLPDEIDAEPGAPQDLLPSMHAAPARSDPARGPPLIEGLPEGG